MADKPKILAFAGSARQGSYNKMLVKIAAAAAEAAGADTTYVDLRDLPMPLYDADLEAREGIPEQARRFKALMLEHDAIFVLVKEGSRKVLDQSKGSGTSDAGCRVNYRRYCCRRCTRSCRCARSHRRR